MTLGNEAQRRHVKFLRNLQQKEAVDQSSLMKQFMSSFSRNMKKAILEDSRGDMDEGERLRQLDALHAQEEGGLSAPRATGDDDADRLSQGLEPRSWSHAQPDNARAGAAAMEEFAEDLQRGLGGPPREAAREAPREAPREALREEREPDMEAREPDMPSREGFGLLNGHRHHAHRAHRAIPAAHSAAVATALFVAAPVALFL